MRKGKATETLGEKCCAGRFRVIVESVRVPIHVASTYQSCSNEPIPHKAGLRTSRFDIPWQAYL